LENFSEFEQLLSDPRRRKARHKDQQLCRQVAQNLGLALAGCADAWLRDLNVADVVPAPDAGRLLVSVYPMTALASGEPGEPGGVMSVEQMSQILGRLEAAAPMLRREVASAITRKRAPELLFRVVPSGEVLP
jgi:ribosome-binding factor A